MESMVISAPPASGHELDELIATMGAELDQTARQVCDAIHRHLDEIADDLYPQTLQSCRANLGLIHTLLREGADPRSATVPREALAYAKEFVRRGLSFELLQRAYRMGQRTLTSRWLEQLRHTVPDTDHFAGALAFCNDWLFAYIETIERELTEVYMREREQWLRGATAMRAETVRTLLDGTVPVDVPDLSRRLGYELERDHVAFLVWSDNDGEDGQELFAELERVAAAVARGLDGRGLLTVVQGRRLACWAGAGAVPVPYRPRNRMHVAVGSPGHGIEGFRRSHQEALLVSRVAGLGRSPGVTHFADVSLDVLMTNDLDEARRFVAAELGPLGAGDDATRRLSSTLRVFLEEGASYVRAARRLGVHENTVTYRVRRAEEILGHRVRERQLELRAALRLARFV
jgi:PucR C-terminal helix-turn-helix domain/GGDEF-like domain